MNGDGIISTGGSNIYIGNGNGGNGVDVLFWTGGGGGGSNLIYGGKGGSVNSNFPLAKGGDGGHHNGGNGVDCSDHNYAYCGGGGGGQGLDGIWKNDGAPGGYCEIYQLGY
jgi:hypothetical protein